MKGIILAGGSGTRLHPITKVVSKQLQTIYNKPMIYYPLTTLILARIREIMIISTPEDTPRFREQLGDGSQFGCNFEYAVQPEPKGLAQALTISSEFVGDEPCCLILGDNLLHGAGLTAELQKARKRVVARGGAHIFGYHVHDPERFGVAEFFDGDRIISIEEKPDKPRSNMAVIGLYFYDSQAAKMAQSIEPSARGEYEITTVNEQYMKQAQLSGTQLSRGFAWLDTGTFDSLIEAANYVRITEKLTNLMIGCPEEAAYRMGFIDRDQLLQAAEHSDKSPYGEYLRNLANDTHVTPGDGHV